MLSIWGNRRIVLCRELTKKFEEFVRGDIESAIEWCMEQEIRGEFCLIIEGGSEEKEQDAEEWWQAYSMKEHVNYYIEEKGMKPKEGIKQAAIDRNISKREIYQAYHID